VGGAIRILLVEDDAAIRETLAEYLACEGYQVTAACDGAEGLARLAERRPDLVVLDLQMPVLDGRGFVSALRADPSTRTIPVILMTGAPAGSLPGAEVEAVLWKPFQLDELAVALRRFGGA